MNKEQLERIKGKYETLKADSVESKPSDETVKLDKLKHMVQENNIRGLEDEEAPSPMQDKDIHSIKDYVAYKNTHTPINQDRDLTRQVQEMKKDIRIIKNILIFFLALASLGLLSALIWGISVGSAMARVLG